MPNTYACKLVSNPNVPIFLPRVCTLVLFLSSNTLDNFPPLTLPILQFCWKKPNDVYRQAKITRIAAVAIHGSQLLCI